ncbi:hypothetical protein BH11BAC1_BH11BAC1_30430 [soil metagenome]
MTLGFTDPATDDYSLTSAATLAINQGTNSGTTNTSFSLMPSNMYQSFDSVLLVRNINEGIIDIGAYESQGTSDLKENESYSSLNLIIFPNPAAGKLHLQFGQTIDLINYSVEMYSLTGDKIFSVKSINKLKTEIDISNFSAGIYLLKAGNGVHLLSTKIVVQ